VEDDRADDCVDEEIKHCLNLANPVSFFLFAGAGSGKTRSLVDAVLHIREKYGRPLWLGGQRCGVITYTNAACDEIKQRLKFDPLVEVSTIHSFAWILIGGFNSDIRTWLRSNLAQEIAELEEAQRKGRTGTKAASERERSIESKRKRLASLATIKKFTYSPSDDNRGRDSLSHSEVIAITASLLTNKRTLQRIFVGKYPFLLIDESQDTNRHLMDALLVVQGLHPTQFCLGLFGDTMQRIYADGKVDLPTGLPVAWRRPAKKMNHRCPARLVRLINKVRSAVDDHKQQARSDKAGGIIRLFIVSAITTDKFRAEAAAAKRMAEITGDGGWNPDSGEFKTLTLEHHMAARRMGFLEFFEPLYKVDRLRTELLQGSLPGLRFFTSLVMPLVDARTRRDEYAVAAIVRKHSPILESKTLRQAGTNQPKLLKRAKEAVSALMALWDDGKSPALAEILRSVSASTLFDVPESLLPLAAGMKGHAEGKSDAAPAEADTERDEAFEAWERALAVPLQQIVAYSQYISGAAPFDTHQGVKGLEFPRVMVVIDDEEARGFLFSFDKLLGAKGKSDADITNERAGKETSIDRTRRLFYVICSRAKETLAVVHYSSDVNRVRSHAISEGWFTSDEIELLT
jgi:DNA helicase-2/ATP-dependent DNA helicase PcrA